MLIDETKYSWKCGGNRDLSFTESPYVASFTDSLKVYLVGGTAAISIYSNKEMTALTLADGSGGGTQVSFYHQDDRGSTWNIMYAMYEERDTYSFGYLLRQADTFYTFANGTLTASLSARHRAGQS